MEQEYGNGTSVCWMREPVRVPLEKLDSSPPFLVGLFFFESLTVVAVFSNKVHPGHERVSGSEQRGLCHNLPGD